MKQSELDAVIRLLDDPDKTVYKIVEEKILSQGSKMIPLLESALYAPYANDLMQYRIQDIVPQLEFRELATDIEDWKKRADDLLKMSWIVSRIKYFSLQELDFRKQFYKVYTEFPRYDLDNYSALERVKIFNYIFYFKIKFKAALEDKFYNPDYCFISNVLDTKIGNPVSLALVYLLFARGHGLPIFGVNLPKNFILAYVDSKNGVSFYINPFNSGTVLGKGEIDRFLKQQEIIPQPQFYQPCSNETFILRLLTHLETSYRENNCKNDADKVLKLINLFDHPLDKDIEWD